MRWMGLETAFQSHVTSSANLWSYKKDLAPTCCTLFAMLGKELISVMLEMKQKREAEMEQWRVFHTTLRLTNSFFLLKFFKFISINNNFIPNVK